MCDVLDERGELGLRDARGQFEHAASDEVFYRGCKACIHGRPVDRAGRAGRGNDVGINQPEDGAGRKRYSGESSEVGYGLLRKQLDLSFGGLLR